jgi:hypothetical protein
MKGLLESGIWGYGSGIRSNELIKTVRVSV